MAMTRRVADAQAAILKTAVSWWAGKRPAGWTLADHMRNPAVNTAVPAEQELASAVAQAVAAGVFEVTE